MNMNDIQKAEMKEKSGRMILKYWPVSITTSLVAVALRQSNMLNIPYRVRTPPQRRYIHLARALFSRSLSLSSFSSKEISESIMLICKDVKPSHQVHSLFFSSSKDKQIR